MATSDLNMATSDLNINDGDRVEVCEGSWMGRIGTAVVDQRETAPGRVYVRFDDDGSEPEVVACTLAELLPSDDPKRTDVPRVGRGADWEKRQGQPKVMDA